MNILIRNRQNKIKTTRKKLLITLTGTTVWRVIKMSFLFKDVLSFTAKNIPKSVLFHHCNQWSRSFISSHFNYNLIMMRWHTFIFSEMVSKNSHLNFLWNSDYRNSSTFIKSIVLHHVGLSLMIQTKEQYKLSVEKNIIEWFKGVNCFNEAIWLHIWGIICHFPSR